MQYSHLKCERQSISDNRVNFYCIYDLFFVPNIWGQYVYDLLCNYLMRYALQNQFEGRHFAWKLIFAYTLYTEMTVSCKANIINQIKFSGSSDSESSLYGSYMCLSSVDSRYTWLFCFCFCFCFSLWRLFQGYFFCN